MGLDIYVYRIKESSVDKAQIDVTNRKEIESMLEAEQKEYFVKYTNKLLKDLNKSFEEKTAEEYKISYHQFIKRLQNLDWFKIYTFHLNPFGYNYYTKSIDKIKTPQEVKIELDKQLLDYYPMYQAYFRKVNFLYQYFRNDMENEWCLVGKEKIENLIELCEQVIKHKGDEDFANQYLPTTSGFFFGSTDYDDWYFADVKDCLTQMKKLNKSLNQDDLVMWEFSW